MKYWRELKVQDYKKIAVQRTAITCLQQAGSPA
jgi:hypothetical protein